MLWLALFIRGRDVLCAYYKANGATPKNEGQGWVFWLGIAWLARDAHTVFSVRSRALDVTCKLSPQHTPLVQLKSFPLDTSLAASFAIS